MAVGSATNSPIQQPKPGVGQTAANVARDLVDGAIGGAHGKSSIAATLGDIAASAIPIVGEQKALRDLYDGVKTGDAGKVVGGIIGLIPVAGGAVSSAVKAASSGGKAAVKVASAQVAEKGVSAAALHFSRVAAESTKKAVTAAAQSPKLKAELAKAGERAYGRTMELLTSHLENMAAEGKLPSLVTREHPSFIDARKAAFTELGIERPDASWQSLFVDRDGKKQVVGKHQPLPEGGSLDDVISAAGFRFIEPPKTEGAAASQPGQYQLMWWKQPDKGTDPSFGLEAFSATPGEAQKIFDAYLQQSKSFRAPKKT